MNTSFEREKQNDEWLTPPKLLAELGPFFLDPCSPIQRPWNTATLHFNKNDNGLYLQWSGRVFCNPPYGKETGKWLKKCAEHKNAIALTSARTETKMFHSEVWEKATAVFFLKGRLRFYTVAGTQGGTAGAPSILIAYDYANAETLRKLTIPGKYLQIH